MLGGHNSDYYGFPFFFINCIFFIIQKIPRAYYIPTYMSQYNTTIRLGGHGPYVGHIMELVETLLG